MPVVSAPAVTLQRATSSGYYPSSGPGFAEVNIASGDDIQLTINPYSGINADKNIRINGSAELSFTNTFTNTKMPVSGGALVKTIENVSGTGLISIFAKPAYGSIPFGYRARIRVGPAYGLEVFDTNGTTRVLSPSGRFGNILAIESILIDNNSNTNYPSSHTISMDMTGINSSNTSVLFKNVPGISYNASLASSFVTFGSSGITISVANGGTSAFLNTTAIVVRF